MKTIKKIIYALSFLVFLACDNFEHIISENNMAFTVNIPGGPVQLNGNPILINATTTTQGGINHRMLCKVTNTNGTIPGGPWTDSIQPFSGAVQFNIQGYVDMIFDYEFQESHDTDDFYFERNSLISVITVEIGEKYVDGNGDLVETWRGSPDTLTILKGKLTRHELNSLTSLNVNFYDYFINTTPVRWLTKLERTFVPGTIQQASRPILHVNHYYNVAKAWFIAPSNDNLVAKCSFVYKNGQVVTVTSDPFAVTKHKLYEIPLSYFAQELNDNQALDRYDVWFEGSVFNVEKYTVFSERENSMSEENPIIFFANSLGVVEAVNCYGQVRQGLQTKGETVYVDNNDFEVKKHTVSLRDASSTTPFFINTGFKTVEERRWLVDLLESEFVWLYLPHINNAFGNPYTAIPVTIVPGNYDIYDSEQDLMSLDIEFRIAHEY